jgi:hypothetical protein
VLLCVQGQNTWRRRACSRVSRKRIARLHHIRIALGPYWRGGSQAGMPDPRPEVSWNIPHSPRRQMLSGHNIEFSCPAASTQHRVELPSCTRRFRRPLRGQLQRFVMFILCQFLSVSNAWIGICSWHSCLKRVYSELAIQPYYRNRVEFPCIEANC